MSIWRPVEYETRVTRKVCLSVAKLAIGEPEAESPQRSQYLTLIMVLQNIYDVTQPQTAGNPFSVDSFSKCFSERPKDHSSLVIPMVRYTIAWTS